MQARSPTQMDWREGRGLVCVVMGNSATHTFLLITFTHSFATLIYTFHSGGDKTRGDVLNILIVQVSSLWQCNINNNKHLFTLLYFVVLVHHHHHNSVVFMVHGPYYCNKVY